MQLSLSEVSEIFPAKNSPTFKRNVMQQGDALDLLGSLPDAVSPLAFFDPQYRSNLDKLNYGNEGSRQKARCALPQMSDDFIDLCTREIRRVLKPSGYCALWSDAYRLGQAHHRRAANALSVVDVISWDSATLGMGCRSRRCGGYLLMLQKPPICGRASWKTRPVIRDHWIEKVDRKIHPHRKPIGLIRALIEAITEPGDLIVDPAAGSFVVMQAAHELGRQFIGCDITFTK